MVSTVKIRQVTLLALLLIGMAVSCLAEAADGSSIEDEALGYLSRYVQFDTSNPPGREIEAVRFLAGILEQEGIPCRILESAPGRANLIARLKGSGRLKPLVLLHHADVVPAGAAGWSVPPFSGAVQEGFIWGRGTVDIKGLGIAHLASLLNLKRSGAPMNRDVIFMVTADEEMGGRMGAGWLLDNHFDLFRDVGFVLTEGGYSVVRDGGLVYVGVELTQKLPVWLRLTAQARAGHSSIPQVDSSVNRLVRALDKLVRYQPPLQVLPEVKRFFQSVAPFQPQFLRQPFLEIDEAVKDPRLVRALSPFHLSLLRNTVSITVLRASEKTNVLAAEAVAELDCRLLPNQDPGLFIQEVGEIVQDPTIRIETILSAHPASSSPENPELFEALRATLRDIDSPAVVGPAVLPGFTDGRYFRERGIPAYGLSPFKTGEWTASGVHGGDERISVEVFRSGVRLWTILVSRLALGTPGGESRGPAGSG